MSLPTDSKARKAIPVHSGFVKYFPDAMVAIAQLSQRANDQHNPGEPLHWAMEKSTDEADAGLRHDIEPYMIGGSEYDADGAAHKVKKAWRAVAELQRWLLAGNAAFLPTPIVATRERCTAREGGTVGPRCILGADHPGGHKSADEPPTFEAYRPRPNPHCYDCGADLREGSHSELCLRSRPQHY